MTADVAAGAWRGSRSAVVGLWIEPALVAAGLAAMVAARWSATRAGFDPLVVGAAFGVALGALALLVSDRPSARVGARAVLLGAAFGLVLIVAAALAPALGGSVRVPGLGRPPVELMPWALITVLVATAEEAILRGALFGRVQRAGGTAAALALTTIVFGVIHFPLYGWHVVPLDLAVGLGLGGLRVVTRGIAAPAIAHALADLATWWL